MTIEDITAKQARESAKFEAAKKIRTILDEIRKQAEDAGEDEDEAENQVVDFVCRE